MCYPSQETMHTIGSRSDHVALPGARTTPSRIKYLHAHPPQKANKKKIRTAERKNSRPFTRYASHPPRTRPAPAALPAHPLTSAPACPASAPPHRAKHATHPNLPAAGSGKFGVPAKSAFFVNTLRTKRPERKGARSGGRTHVLPHQAWTVSTPMFPFRGYCRLRTSGVARPPPLPRRVRTRRTRG